MEDVQVLIFCRGGQPGESWAAFLRGRGWDARLCRGAAELRECARTAFLNLILAEESLAGELSAARSGSADRAAAVLLFGGPAALTGAKEAQYLISGFDDVVRTDIDPRILEAKLLAKLRRALPAAAREREEVRSRSGLLRVNKARRTARIRQKGGFRDIPGLTKTELEILALLVAREGAVVERRFIVEAVWRGREINFQNVDKHVEGLRAKLPRRAGRIDTVYGAGYRYREEK